MSYCVNCGVELEASLKRCPLCETPVINPKLLNIEVPPSPYPTVDGQVEVVKRKDLGILLTIVLSATSITCFLLNLLVFQKSWWSLFIIGICLCMFVFTFPAVFYLKWPLYLSLLADGVALAIYLYLISRVTPADNWFWRLGLPIVIIMTILIEIYTLLSRLLPFTFLVGALYIFLEIPTFCVLLELLIRSILSLDLRITWSAVVLTVCAIIDISLITILAKKRLRNELRRRLHF